MAYETFSRTGIRVGSPTLAITPNGRISLNAAACRILASLGSKHVLLLWDKEKLKMAVKATTKAEKNTFSVSMTLHGGTTRAKSFFDYAGWSASLRETLPATWNPTEKMFEVSLPAKHLLRRDSRAT
jgi:hypothetical protein